MAKPVYQLSKIRPTQMAALTKLEIKGQKELEAKFGEKLDLVKAYSFIKDQSEDFTKSDPLALEADAVFAKLLTKRGFWDSSKPVSNSANASDAKAKRIRINKAKVKVKMKMIKMRKRMAAAVA